MFDRIHDFLDWLLVRPSRPRAKVFDVEQDVAQMLASIPPCTARLVIAGPQYAEYSTSVKCEISILAKDLLPVAEQYCSGEEFPFWSQRVQTERVALLRWLRATTDQPDTISDLPWFFAGAVEYDVPALVANGTARVFCLECGEVVTEQHTTERDRHKLGPRTTWTTDWRCPKGHVLRSDEERIEFFLRREP